MQKPPDIDGTFDIERLEKIVRAMDYLGQEAAKTGVEEVATIVESTFRIICASYYCILRHDMMTLLAPDGLPTDGP